MGSEEGRRKHSAKAAPPSASKSKRATTWFGHLINQKRKKEKRKRGRRERQRREEQPSKTRTSKEFVQVTAWKYPKWLRERIIPISRRRSKKSGGKEEAPWDAQGFLRP